MQYICNWFLSKLTKDDFLLVHLLWWFKVKLLHDILGCLSSCPCRFEDEIEPSGSANDGTETTPHYHWYQSYHNHRRSSSSHRVIVIPFCVLKLFVLAVFPCRLRILLFWSWKRNRVWDTFSGRWWWLTLLTPVTLYVVSSVLLKSWKKRRIFTKLKQNLLLHFYIKICKHNNQNSCNSSLLKF